MNGVINLHFLTILMNTLQDTISFGKEIGILPKLVQCPNCKRLLQKPYILKRFQSDCKEIRYQCNKKQCRSKGRKNTVSLKTGTWFGKSHITLKKSLFLTYCFVHQMSYTDTIRETSIELINNENDELKQVTTSSETVCDYKMYCREICVNIIIDESDDQIGGIGLTVEIDESKFGKRKYNRGRVIEGQWVLGGICRETKQVFMTTVPSRDKNTLLPILKKKIKPGTTIISDCWKSYDCLSQEDFEHLTVNHSVNFVDPQSGCHTQNIENLWWQVKRQLPDTYTRHNQLYLHLAEYLWRNMKRKEKDIFKEFLKDASKYYSGPKCNSFYIYICVFYIKIRHLNSKYFVHFVFVEILK